MRLINLVVFGSLVACGGGGDDPPVTPDAPDGPTSGFERPTAPLKANMEVADGDWMEIGAADLSCLNTPTADLPTTVEVALSTVVRDFQSNSLVPNTTVSWFRDQEIDNPIGTTTADADAALTITLPVGTTRFGYKMLSDSSLDTLLLNQIVDPDSPTQTVGSIQIVSKSTAQLLPALIGVARTPGTGVLAGAVRDCQNREMSNFIATVTTNPARTADEIMHAPGADSYYFSSSVGIPVSHDQEPMASEDGLFMVIELQPAATAYVQVWGYPDDAALAADELTLIAELETQVIADTVITGSYEPLRTP